MILYILADKSLSEHKPSNTTEYSAMKTPFEYLIRPACEQVDRNRFYADIQGVAITQLHSLGEILRDFFSAEPLLSPKHKGLFALYSSPTANLVHGAVVLIHALGIHQGDAGPQNILVNYLGCSPTDPMVWGASWSVDAMMNWPTGTTMPGTVEKTRNAVLG